MAVIPCTARFKTAWQHGGKYPSVVSLLPSPSGHGVQVEPTLGYILTFSGHNFPMIMARDEEDGCNLRVLQPAIEVVDGDIGLDIDPSEDGNANQMDRQIAWFVEENLGDRDINMRRVIDQRNNVSYVYCWFAGQPSAAILQVRRRLSVGNVRMYIVNTGHHELQGALRASSLRVVFDDDQAAEAFMSLNMAAIEDRARQIADILAPNTQADAVS